MEEYIDFFDKNNNLILNTFKDFGLLIQSITIPEAEIKEEIEEIPGSSDILDYTEAINNDVNYNRRTIPIELSGFKHRNEFLTVYSEFLNRLHGKKVKMILSEEPNFFWIGRVSVGDINAYNITRSLTLNVVCDPYKYEINSSADDWLWDPFNFENGIINECKDLEIKGTLDVTIYGRRKHVIPTFDIAGNVTVTFNGVTYELTEGTNEVLDIELLPGENKLKFEGTGTVTIDYRGGSL